MPHVEILAALEMTPAEWGLLAHAAIGDSAKTEELTALKERGARLALIERRAKARIHEEDEQLGVVGRVATMHAAELEDAADTVVAPGRLDRLASVEARLDALEAVWATLGHIPTTTDAEEA
jgi:hypothetical protein